MSNKINTENELTVVEGATRTAGRVKTIVVIERNLDAIKTADWIIDLGPEGGGGGGDGGGEVVAAGTPEQVAAHPHSHTGRFLAPVLGR